MTSHTVSCIMQYTMARTPTFPLFDRILDGQLAKLLLDLKAAGNSVPEIRDILRDDYEISVSIATVARWFRDVEALLNPEPAK